ncbi:autophagy protein [Kockovaella imperatae]|uniref:Autophagy-related protein n=1 Tax=Kockovaella imperatae TaxID=4999 RepID=A0A1Y1UDY9_9TREE|nr:autophagy protein [Kockovaella imperatae]ORX36209.1 autophagy protein [Kockovaella imperatae]
MSNKMEATETPLEEKKDAYEISPAPVLVDDRPVFTTGDEVGAAIVEQQHVIPSTGQRKPTSKLEYILFNIFYFSNNGAPIGGNGGALRQALLNLQFPNNYVPWGGQYQPMNSMLLDVTGILFAVQLVVLMTLGPYADYGNWRPWIMIFFQLVLEACQFAMCGLSKPGQWQVAQALYVLGSISANVVGAFYAATYPGIVRDLPSLIKSEEEVRAGTKTPEEHAKLDMYERAQLYNLVNITGSALVVLFYAIAIGIAAKIGYDSPQTLIKSYRILMGYFGVVTVLCTTPFFLVQKHRPGQQLPKGTSMWSAGPKQVWSAAKSARHLKQCLMYLAAYLLVSETFGTYFNVTGILQNEIINYSPTMLNVFSLCSDLGGGSGTVFMWYLQKRYRFSIKKAVLYGACMTLVPSLWGGIGCFTNKIGFKHVWEFWVASFWNFQTAAWGAYSTSMISEVVPAPKAFMFFSLFNLVSQTSGFIGPFVSAAIIKAAHGNNNVAYWFLLGMGVIGCVCIYLVDTEKGKIDVARYLEREAQELYDEEQRTHAANIEEKAGVVGHLETV